MAWNLYQRLCSSTGFNSTLEEFLLESISGMFFSKGVLFCFYNSPKMYLISSCDWLALLKVIVEVTFLEVTLLLLLFWCRGCSWCSVFSPALLPQQQKTQTKTYCCHSIGLKWEAEVCNVKIRCFISISLQPFVKWVHTEVAQTH